MVKKQYILIIFLLFWIDGSFAQTKKPIVRKQKNPFEMVHVDDSVRNKLYKFIEKQEREDYSQMAGISIHHLLGEDRTHNFQFVEGIYWFKLMGPHFDAYFFMYTKKEGVYVFEKYTVEGLLLELLECFKRNEAVFDESKKIAYIKSMVDGLDHRDEEGDSEKIVNGKIVH